MDRFDYEGKLWGGHEVKVSPTYLGALRLQYCLEDLQGIRGKVLEVGCGGGGMARAIKAYRPDLEVYGCDVSHTAIQAAQSQSRGVVFVVGDAHYLPYMDAHFAAVLVFDVLEHLECPKGTVEQIYRILKPDGLFHVFVPCEGDLHTLHGLLARIGWRAKERYGGHIQRFGLSEVRTLLEGQSFRVVQARWSGHVVNQFADVAYFSALSLRGKASPYSVESYLASARPGIVSRFIGTLKAIVAVVSYYESSLLNLVPGWGAHLTCRK